MSSRLLTLSFALILTLNGLLSGREFGPGTNVALLRQGGIGLVATGDMNRDGIADIIGIGTVNNTIGIRINAAGGVDTTLEIPLNITGRPTELLVQDLSGEGDPEVVTLVVNSTSATAAICVLQGNRQLRFGPVACTNIPNTLVNPVGTLRLAVARVPALSLPVGPTPPPVTALLLIEGTAGFIVPATLVDTNVTFGPRAAAGHSILSAAPIDTNGDGYSDLIYSSEPQGLFEANLVNILRGSIITSRFDTSAWGEVVAADFNADSRVDVAVLDRLTGRLRIFAGTPTALEYREQTALTVPDGAAQAYRQLFAYDADRDGRLDLVARTVGGIVLYRNTGPGFTFTTLRDLAPVISANSLFGFTLAEINGDGQTDLLYIADNNTTTPAPTPAASLIVHTGRPSFTETTLELSAASVNAGTSTRLTARVQRASQTGGYGTIGGSVQFYSGDTLLETVAVQPPPAGSEERLFGIATLDRVFPPGVANLRATFTGSTGYLTSPSRTVTLTVRGAASELRLTQVPGRINRGDVLRVSVEALAAGVSNITGTINALRGTSRLASAPLENGRTTIAVPTADLPLGPQRLRFTLDSPVLPAAETEAVVFVSGLLNVVNAASYGAVIAPDSIAVLQAPGLGAPSTLAGGLPWPTELSGVSITIRDSRGITLPGRIYFTGANQINFLVPAGLFPGEGEARLSFAGSSETIATPIRIADSQPGIFTASGDGRGVPAALAVRVAAGGAIEPVAVFNCAGGGGCLPTAIDVTADEPVYLSLYGTGWRGATDVMVTIGGQAIRPDFAGAHPEIPGLDQINLRLPLNVRGSATLVVTAGGVSSNPVQLLFR